MRGTYYIFYLFTRFFKMVPFWALYLLSDIIYLLLYYCIPYRKQVIRQNIERSFPDINKTEKTKIIKGFYHNLCDIFLEGIKGFTLTKKDLLKRYVFVNPEVMNDLYEKGQEVISVGAHYANWEWGIMAAPLQIQHKIYAFYTPMSNRSIDTYMRLNRQKWGTELVATLDVRNAFSERKDKPVTYFFGADQSPIMHKDSHWVEFLNQDTACMKSPEFFSKFHNLPVVYFNVQRVKRGHYTVTLKVLTMDPANTESGEITENYMRTLEQIIMHKPEDYLWSHKRWKHTRKIRA